MIRGKVVAVQKKPQGIETARVPIRLRIPRELRAHIAEWLQRNRSIEEVRVFSARWLGRPVSEVEILEAYTTYYEDQCEERVQRALILQRERRAA